MKPEPVALVIGDLVASRRSGDRTALHASLTHALAEVNDLVAHVRPLKVSAGDEYQGVYATVGDALAATLLVRARLLPEADVRHGVGWGPVTVLDAQDRVEDGPGWWAAREAIDHVKQAQSEPRSRSLRTACRRAEGVSLASLPAVNAALVLRDELVSGLSPRAVWVLRGLLEGRSQQEIADELAISPSAVSQRVRSDGLAAVVTAHELLAKVRHDGEEEA